MPRTHDVRAFAQAIRAIGEPIHNRTAEEISMAKLLTLLLEVTGLFDMQTRPELILLQKTMVVVEGVARSLDPHLDMWGTVVNRDGFVCAVAFTGEAASDGSLAAGINLNFSLDPNSGFKLSRQPLAGAGAVRARVFRDLNDNGVREPSEPLEAGALVTTGRRVSEKPTDSAGSVILGGLQTYQPLTIGIDESSLADPMLVPKKAMQVVVPRPGVPAEVEIPLVGGGDIEGAIVRSGEVPIEGLDLELVDAAGRLIATARSDFDGFFLFQRVPYGRYSVRVAKDSALALGLEQALEAAAEVTAEKPVVRLGTVQARAPPRIASIE